MTDPAGIPALLDAIRHLEGVEAEHVETAHVRDVHKGLVAWEGDVEIFQLQKHPRAERAYAWSEPTTGDARRFFVVLHATGVDSPLQAVRASILADAHSRKR